MKLHGKARDIAAQILDAFKAGVIPAMLATTFVSPPVTGSPMTRWSWRNRLIAALHGHRDARGFRQWETAGRRVKRGERAFYILGPCTVTAKQEEPERGIQPGDPILIGFRAIPVFGYTQTEGEPVPWAEEERRFFDSRPLADVARSWGLELRIKDADGFSHGAFTHRDGRGLAISVATDSLNTWAHELVHATDLRLGTMTTARGQQLDNEIVAQLGASVLLECLGHAVESDRGKTFGYLEHYARKHDRDLWTLCSELLDRTCACVSHLLEEAALLPATTSSDGASSPEPSVRSRVA